MSEFVGSNIFVRFLTGDDPQKYARCVALFQRTQRSEVQLVASESVIAEVTYVLSSRSLYRIPRETVAVALRTLLADPAFRLDHNETVLDALSLWQDSNLDFADCISAGHVRRLELDGVYSYDRDFDRIPSVRRLEP